MVIKSLNHALQLKKRNKGTGIGYHHFKTIKKSNGLLKFSSIVNVNNLLVLPITYDVANEERN